MTGFPPYTYAKYILAFIFSPLVSALYASVTFIALADLLVLNALSLQAVLKLAGDLYWICLQFMMFYGIPCMIVLRQFQRERILYFTLAGLIAGLFIIVISLFVYRHEGIANSHPSLYFMVFLPASVLAGFTAGVLISRLQNPKKAG